ncbi:MAG: hypothetical protein QM503_03890 [Bacteroidota bacterium]
MKKILLISTIFLMSGICFGQSLNIDFKEYSKQVDSSGIYLQKASADMVYGMLFTALAAGSFYWASTIVADNPDDLPTLQYAIGGGFAVVAFGCYIAQIVHTNKAGIHLRKANRIYQKQQTLSLSLHSGNDGVGLALKF